MLGVPAGPAPRGFLTPAAARARRTGVSPTADAEMSIAELRDLVAVEAGRLREAATLPVADRRDLLDDLASRLDVLLASVADSAADMLRTLVGLLRGSAPLDEKWATAARVLSEFGSPGTGSAPSSGTGGTQGSDSADGGGSASETGAGSSTSSKKSKPFWKR